MLRNIFPIVLCFLMFSCINQGSDTNSKPNAASMDTATASQQNPPSVERIAIKTDKAPLPVGPYSQAIKVGNMLYLAGQIGRNPISGEMQSESLETEVRQVMANLQAVLEAGGSDFDYVVQTTIYLNDLNDFSEMNAIYASYFNDAPPARATVEVSNLARDARLEIAMTAVIPTE